MISGQKAGAQVSDKKPGGTADHSKFEALKGPFASGPDVTKACLTCHNEAGHQFMKSIHWKWDYDNPDTGQKLGKKNVINNFCTNSRGNEGMCAQCHAGYGWKDETFDFTNQENIDCVVCHDGTGTYYKTPNSKGHSACTVMFEGKKEIDFTKVAQNVSMPQRSNCGTCHFNGGGGDGVKHGDLDSSLKNPAKDLDVHMATDGLNFSCNACHVSNQHQWAGSRYHVTAIDTEGKGKPGLRRDVATCESCHGTEPHEHPALKAFYLNSHTDKVACQSCHIPTFARGGVATVVNWDWTTAGKTKDGVGYKVEGYIQGNGGERPTYKSIKGSFEYGENVEPTYQWFDGQMEYQTIDRKLDPARQPIPINDFKGSYDDPGSRIWPFKRMHTTQPYDKGNNTLVYMHLWGEDDKAFWGNYDFGAAIAEGMRKNNVPYSGEYGFVETVSWWPITHMVAPKENALGCQECHATDGRLAALTGFYMPGRDSFRWLDIFGYAAFALAFGGTALHGFLRFVMKRRKGSN
ncbi:MAG: tetrathionate reductase family octaheme c-type cytochrome [Hyphomicrobiales bacterium]